jgi:hypothetical protein
MRRRTDESVTQVILRPRSGVFGFGAGNGTLTANVPAHPQSNPEAGPPFSFWGRGVATVFRLQVAPPSQMDLSRLSAIHITVDCIAFAPQGGPAPPPVTTIAPDVRLMDPSQLLVAAAGDELMV